MVLSRSRLTPPNIKSVSRVFNILPYQVLLWFRQVRSYLLMPFFAFFRIAVWYEFCEL